MMSKKVKIPYKNGEIVELYAICDTHFGHVGVQKQLFQQHVNEIKERNAYWIHLGDIADAVTVTDHRYDILNIDKEMLTINEQYSYATESLKPIAGTCLGIMCGNHDDTIRTQINTGYDYASFVARDLNASYLGYMAFLKLEFENNHNDRWGQTIYLWHGKGGGRKVGSPLNRLTDLAADYDADHYLIGHYHRLVTVQNAQLYHSSNGRHDMIMKRNRIFGICGGYLEGFVDDKITYIERDGYSPSVLGCLRLEFDPENRRTEFRTRSE
jgi:predicted phosphodiesterase